MQECCQIFRVYRIKIFQIDCFLYYGYQKVNMIFLSLKCSHEKSPSLVTVNAMYIPSQNRIILPATILQEPLFHVSLPAAANFGGMGSIIGREVTHGFDRTRQGINQSGKLRNWWSNVTVSRFQERAACLVKQYSSYNISDRFIDGDRTLSMTWNIRDTLYIIH